MSPTPHQHPPRAASRPLEPAHLERAADLLRALADPQRLRLLCVLADGEACVSELLTDGDANLSTVSQRLKTLRQAGLVERRREGKHIFYHLADDHVRDLVDNALAHASHPEGPRHPQAPGPARLPKPPRSTRPTQEPR